MHRHQGRAPRGDLENRDTGGELGTVAHRLRSRSRGLWGPPPGGLLGSLELRAEGATATFPLLQVLPSEVPLKMEEPLKFYFFFFLHFLSLSLTKPGI